MKEYNTKKSYIKNRFDLDAIETLNKIKFVSKKENILIPAWTWDEYISQFKESIILYCKKTSQDYDYHLDINVALVIDSNSPQYESLLSTELIFHDKNTIYDFLNYQKKIFKGNDYAKKFQFVGLVRNIYERISKNSPINIDENLENIAIWCRAEENPSKQIVVIKNSPNEIEKKASQKKNKPQKIQRTKSLKFTSDFNHKKLIKDMIELGWFNENDKDKLNNIFEGRIPKTPLRCLEHASFLCSFFADILEAKKLLITKTSLKIFLLRKITYKDKACSADYISRIISKNGKGRIEYNISTKKSFLNVNNYIISPEQKS